MVAKRSSLKDLLSVRRAAYLWLEDVEQLISEVLLIQELDDETRNLSLDLHVWVRHEAYQESCHHVKQAELITTFNLIYKEVIEVKLQYPVNLTQKQVPLSKLYLNLCDVLRL